MGIKFYKKNIYDLTNQDAVTTVTDAVAVSTGQSFVNFMRNRDLRSGWITTGSSDAANTEVEIDFNDVREFDRIMILAHNLKSFNIKHWDGVDWQDFSTPIVETTNSAGSNYYEFTKVFASKVKLTILGTQVANSDKSVQQIIITESLGELSIEPEMIPVFDKNKKVNKYLSGKSFISKGVGSFGVRLRMNSVSGESDLALCETLFNSFEGFLISLSGGTTSQYETIREGYRLQDVYYVACANDYTPEWLDSRYANGMKLDLRLVEVN